MTKKLVFEGDVWNQKEYLTEEDFEKTIIQHAPYVFGEKALYIDIKKRLNSGDILTIPDGYLIDLTIPSKPKLYIIENELAKHDPFKHIGSQVLKFAISYKKSGRKMKKILLEEIQKNDTHTNAIKDALEKGSFRNIDDILEYIIYDEDVGTIVVIDEATEELHEVLKNLTMKTDVIEFQTFKGRKGTGHIFTPLYADVEESLEKSKTRIEDMDTIIVPAREDGFEETFLGEDCWYAIRISSAMIPQLKYIAAYRVGPVYAITHYAEVKEIKPYKETGKYIVYFAKPAETIGPIKLEKNDRKSVPQSPRYANFKKMKKAKTMKGVF